MASPYMKAKVHRFLLAAAQSTPRPLATRSKLLRSVVSERRLLALKAGQEVDKPELFSKTLRKRGIGLALMFRVSNGNKDSKRCRSTASLFL